MKQYSLHIIFVLVGFILLNACTEEEIGTKRDNTVAGIPTSVKLSLAIPGMDKVETRAASDSEISDLYLFSFDGSTGDLIAAEKYLSPTSSVIFKTLSGKQEIYAIANTNTDMLPGVNTDLDRYVEEKSCTKQTILDLSANLGSEAIQFGSSTMLMSGKWQEEKDGISICNIGIDGEIIQKGEIKLKRVASQIEFKVTGENFTLESFQICEVPKQVNVFEEKGYVTAVESFSTDIRTIPNTSKNFTFYMLENLAQGTNCFTENDREVLKVGSLKDKDASAREFKNVNKPAAYVLLRGSYKGYSNGYGEVEAKVVYCIHLGKGAGSNYQANDAKNDFNTYRNCQYTYKITVNGVNNIIAEVLEEDKDYPREEGDVIISAGDNILTCDAHFEAREMVFKRNDLDGLVLDFMVKDPITGNVYKESDNAEEASYNWVSFKKNDEQKNNQYKYPGDSSPDLMGIKDFVSELKKWVAGDGDSKLGDSDEVNLTCFINEFYYKGQEWSTFVNTDDREMLILYSKRTQQESSGNSSVTVNSAYVIKQRSIKTVYSQTRSSYTAWGIESVNETGMLQIANKAGSNKDNGRENFPKIENRDYATFLNYSSSTKTNMMRDDYKNAYYACLQRNRDENGDDKIDGDEIKWYLPTSGQYVSLWLGNEALTAEASIFNIDWDNTFKSFIPDKYHYVGSDKNNKNVFWAEEGITVGGDGSHVEGEMRQYRCVRNLGDGKPEGIFTHKRVSGGIEIDLTNLNKGSLKDAPSTNELDVHNEREVANKPYRKFIISEDVTNNGGTWNNMTVNKYPCKSKGTGWRIPNQRELAIIYLLADNYPVLKAYNVFAKSAYSGIAQNGYVGKHGYVYNGGVNVSLVEKNGATARVRCVKDLNE